MMTTKQSIFYIESDNLTDSITLLKKSEDTDYLLSVLKSLKNELDDYSISISSLEILKTMSFYLDHANREKIEIPGELRDFIFRVYEMYLNSSIRKASGKEARKWNH